MIRIAICDDEKETVNLVKKYIDEVTKELEIMVDVTPYIDWKSIEYDLSEDILYDIIFMDIEYGGINGIDFVGQIKQKYPTTNIIFITGHHEFVFDVFEVQPLGFLRKPIGYEELKKVLVSGIEKSKVVDMFQYSNNRIVYKLPLKEVIWFNIDGKKIHIKTIQDEREFYGKLDEVEQQVGSINDRFIRVSQSYLVNSDFISSVGHNVVTVSIGSRKEELSVGRSYKDMVLGRYMNTWEEI